MASSLPNLVRSSWQRTGFALSVRSFSAVNRSSTEYFTSTPATSSLSSSSSRLDESTPRSRYNSDPFQFPSHETRHYQVKSIPHLPLPPTLPYEPTSTPFKRHLSILEEALAVPHFRQARAIYAALHEDLRPHVPFHLLEPLLVNELHRPNFSWNLLSSYVDALSRQQRRDVTSLENVTELLLELADKHSSQVKYQSLIERLWKTWLTRHSDSLTIVPIALRRLVFRLFPQHWESLASRNGLEGLEEELQWKRLLEQRLVEVSGSSFGPAFRSRCEEIATRLETFLGLDAVVADPSLVEVLGEAYLQISLRLPARSQKTSLRTIINRVGGHSRPPERLQAAYASARDRVTGKARELEVILGLPLSPKRPVDFDVALRSLRTCLSSWRLSDAEADPQTYLLAARNALHLLGQSRSHPESRPDPIPHLRHINRILLYFPRSTLARALHIQTAQQVLQHVRKYRDSRAARLCREMVKWIADPVVIEIAARALVHLHRHTNVKWDETYDRVLRYLPPGKTLAAVIASQAISDGHSIDEKLLKKVQGSFDRPDRYLLFVKALDTTQDRPFLIELASRTVPEHAVAIIRQLGDDFPDVLPSTTLDRLVNTIVDCDPVSAYTLIRKHTVSQEAQERCYQVLAQVADARFQILARDVRRRMSASRERHRD